MEVQNLISNVVHFMTFICGGLIVGLGEVWQKNRVMKFVCFGHFMGVLISFGLAYVVSLEDPSGGIAIRVFYRLFTISGIIIGFKVGAKSII